LNLLEDDTFSECAHFYNSVSTVVLYSRWNGLA
jgi:hypothetical protein